MHGLLNARRRHRRRSRASRRAGKIGYQTNCSTPEGVIVVDHVRRQSQASGISDCSTPEGVIVVDHRAGNDADRAVEKLLNARRRHRRRHPPASPARAGRGLGCSTPEGVIVVGSHNLPDRSNEGHRCSTSEGVIVVGTPVSAWWWARGSSAQRPKASSSSITFQADFACIESLGCSTPEGVIVVDHSLQADVYQRFFETAQRPKASSSSITVRSAPRPRRQAVAAQRPKASSSSITRPGMMQVTHRKTAQRPKASSSSARIGDLPGDNPLRLLNARRRHRRRHCPIVTR